MKSSSAGTTVDNRCLFLKSLPLILFVLFMYYYVEVSFQGRRHLTSYLRGSFLPTRKAEFVDKIDAILAELSQIRPPNTGISPCRMHDSLVAILDGDCDKPLVFQRADVGANLPFANAEKIGEMAVGGVAAIFVVQGMNFHKQNFFHKRKLFGEPNLLGNPDTFEIAWGLFHPPNFTTPVFA